MNRKNRLTRREFVKLAGATLAPWRSFSANAAAEALRGSGLSLPCAAGDVTESGAIAWLRAEEESSVVVEYGKDASLQGAARSAPISVATGSDYTGKVILRNLEPHSTYYYRALIPDRRPGPVARFVTAPRADQAANVRFAFSGDTRQRYQRSTIMDAIRERKPDFFLHLGDTVYADREGRASHLSQFREKYINNSRDVPTQRLFAETSLIVVWDDHEAADNFRSAVPYVEIEILTSKNVLLRKIKINANDKV